MGSFSSEKEILIGLIGVTGAGKSTFASVASGRRDLKIGNTLRSCTQEPQAVRFELDGRPILLVDTPGFDDDERTDVEILEIIATYLSENSHKKQKLLLDGLILLHPITANRIGGTERKRTRLLQAILGENAYKRVIIATTMWDDLRNDGDKFAYRLEGRLQEGEVWSEMVKRGARVVRHFNNPQSAHAIIRMIIDKSEAENGGVPLQIQEELDRLQGRVAKTSAGKQVKAIIEKDTQALVRERERHLAEKPQNGGPELEIWKQELADIERRIEVRHNESQRLEKLVVGAKALLHNSLKLPTLRTPW